MAHMLDLKIAGGTIIDGSGAPGRIGDLGIRDGRIVALGKVDEAARETIDATGKVVAPGFVDSHTHYDAQVFWDPTLSPSCYHGVTTVVGGFCGFSIAPLTPEAAPYLQRMLSRVEGMPLKTLETAVPWNWRSFGEFLAAIDGKTGLNCGFFAGHSAIRRSVMGARAVGEDATPADIEAMNALLDASLSEGALGLSTTISPTHNDMEGQPVPSRWASREEHLELARVVSRHEGTGLEMLPNLDFPEGTSELMADYSLAGQRAVNWNILMLNGKADAWEVASRQLAVSDLARSRGGEVIALVAPVTPGVFKSLHNGVTFDAFPGLWRELFKQPVAERIETLRDPAVRRQLAEDVASMPETAALKTMSRFEGHLVVSTKCAANQRLEGRRVGEIAAEQGKTPLDALLDIAIADDLETIFQPDLGGEDAASWDQRRRLYADDRTLLGASDAGAHLDILDSFAFSTTILSRAVREKGIMPLEQAVHELTGRPARYFGLIDRGTLCEGAHADVVVFDPATVGRGPTYRRFDVPGGEEYRLYAEAVGIDHVLVNGVEVVRNGEHTGALPGTVLRSGRDTKTMAIDALQAKAA
ncbi:MAG: amidohydrolase family protein [Novosphingobium sp.]